MKRSGLPIVRKKGTGPKSDGNRTSHNGTAHPTWATEGLQSFRLILAVAAGICAGTTSSAGSWRPRARFQTGTHYFTSEREPCLRSTSASAFRASSVRPRIHRF